MFSLLANSILDETRLQYIVDTESIMKEDQIFVKKREILIKRIMAQLNLFKDQHKLFIGEFIFQQEDLREYMLTQFTRQEYCKNMMEKVKAANPEQARIEEARVIHEPKKSVARRLGES